MSLPEFSESSNPPRPPEYRVAQRLAAVRAEILRLRAAPYACGRNGPHRLVRDEYILQGIAAHLHACMIEASSA